jgi:hypothetical protein
MNIRSIIATVLCLSAVTTALTETPLRIREGSSSYGKTTMTVTGNQVRLICLLLMRIGARLIVLTRKGLIIPSDE